MIHEMTALESSRYVHRYGQTAVIFSAEWGEEEVPNRDFRVGVCSDHVRAAAKLPGVRVVEGDLTTYVVDDAAGGVAYPVVCGAIVEVLTEDGPSDGRCGLLSTDRETLECERHNAEHREWVAMSEMERLHWEREHDRMHP